MYIHITTKCNMNCEHCCFSYGRNYKNAKDMPFETFKKIIDDYSPLINKHNGYITLGGAEPTLHSEFWKILGYAQSKGFPWLATNGSKTEDTLMLCDLAKKGTVAVALSQDEWHDPIDPQVIEAFQDGLELKEYDGYNCWLPPKNGDEKSTDLREIRMVKKPIRGGRARKFRDERLREGCPCPGIHFKVNGDIYACGCDDAPKIGDYKQGIFGIEYKYYDLFNGCYKESNTIKDAKNV